MSTSPAIILGSASSSTRGSADFMVVSFPDRTLPCVNNVSAEASLHLRVVFRCAYGPSAPHRVGAGNGRISPVLPRREKSSPTSGGSPRRARTRDALGRPAAGVPPAGRRGWRSLGERVL